LVSEKTETTTVFYAPKSPLGDLGVKKLNTKCMWKFKWLRNWKEIYADDFRNYWLAQFNSSIYPTVFGHPDMALAWLKTYQAIRNIHPLFCIAGKNEITVIYPLVVWKQNWKNAFLKKIIPVGYSDFDYTEPLFSGDNVQDEDINSFFEELSKQFRVLGIHYDMVDIRCLRSSIYKSEIFSTTDVACPYIYLDKYTDSSNYFASLSSKLGQDIIKRTKKLKELGNLEFLVIKEKENALLYLQSFLELYKKRRQKAYIPKNLHQNLIENASKNNLLLLFVCLLDNVPICIRLSFCHKDIIYSYLPVFDEKFNQYSIGNIHRYESIKWSMDNHYRIFDLLRGQKSYKDKWATDTVVLSSFRIDSENIPSVIKKTILRIRYCIFK